MNLRYRTRQPVSVARPAPVQDALGGVSEGFSAGRIRLHAFVSPAGGGLSPPAPGITREEECHLILPPGADIRPRDGVWLGESEDAPPWRCLRVERYPLHTRAVVIRREGV